METVVFMLWGQGEQVGCGAEASCRLFCSEFCGRLSSVRGAHVRSFPEDWRLRVKCYVMGGEGEVGGVDGPDQRSFEL